jgi:hypothetical protein
MAVEAHGEEEQAHGVNLDGRCGSGVDLDGGHVVEAHAESTEEEWVPAGVRWGNNGVRI